MKKIYILTAVFLLILAGLLAVWKFSNKPIYGNELAGIENLIESSEMYRDSRIDILEVYDYGDYRFVAFLSDNRPGIIEFRLDDNGNYVWRSSEVSHDVGLEIFSMSMFNEDVDQIIVSVYSQDVAIQDYTFKANEDLYNVTFDAGTSGVNWTILKKSSSGEYRFDWFIPEELI
jgi:hypothetical protein